jgi:hypothetical protein
MSGGGCKTGTVRRFEIPRDVGCLCKALPPSETLSQYVVIPDSRNRLAA